MDRIPGSVAVISPEQLRRSRVFSTQEALRKVAGVVVRDDEGFGARPNIGIRGLNPTRSTKVLLLEDGVPITIAPYGDNAAYYHPPIERMESVEVLKGAGQVLYGPHTVGGVINYRTPAIARTPTATLSLSGGTRGFRTLRAAASGTVGETGLLADLVRRETLGARENTRTTVDDASVKLRVPLAGSQQLTLRGSLFREQSQVTYAGLTEAEYAANPRQNPFADDAFDITRLGGAVAHQVGATPQRRLVTTAYAHTVQRDWWRQSSSSAQRPNDRSDPACGGMANLRTTCGNEGRLRDYVVAGVEPRLAWQRLGARHLLQLDAGVRLHHEVQERQQVNGGTPRARTVGLPGDVNAGIVEDNRRTTLAHAAFVQARVVAGALSVTTGVRGEAMRLTRLNRRPVPGHPEGVAGATSLAALIPGVGATWTVRPGITLFTGLHRGFSPPRPEDIISNSTGGVVELDPEASWNSEVGARWQRGTAWQLEATLFSMDFANQVVPASIAGGVGAALTNAGRTRHRGAELSVQAAAEGGAFRPFVELAATWLPVARYVGARWAYVGTTATDGVGKVFLEPDAARTRTRVSVTGNRLPYAPTATLTSTVGVRHRDGAELRVELVAVGAQASDPVNTRVLAADGQQGPIAANALWNATANVPLGRTGLGGWVAVKNLTDRTVVVDRTRGLLPGMPRLVLLGVSQRW
ncbi:MAG: TonB-dependent receptor [Gemmatimonadetes bacterium]|nr:TonB-dependent receptor [Gemmatimonadota bacterium]